APLHLVGHSDDALAHIATISSAVARGEGSSGLFALGFRPERLQMRCGVHEGHDQLALHRMRIGMVWDAEVQLFALRLGNVERSEHPIPERQATAEVLVEVLRIVGVMYLMVRRANE